jgi:WD40 repeat protein
VALNVLFAQCIHIRSIYLNYTTIGEKSRRFLELSKAPCLVLLWAKVHSKEALIMTLEGHSDHVNSVAISTDNSKIVSGSAWKDNTIKVWDLHSAELLNTLEYHSREASVVAVAITHDNRKSFDRTVKVWDLDKEKYYSTYKFDDEINIIALSKDVNLIVLASSVGDLYVGALFTQNSDSG